MKRTIHTRAMLFAALCLTAFVAPPTRAQDNAGIPRRLHRLTYLATLRQTRLTARQQTEVLVSWLSEERRQPTPDTVGIGGGAIDSGYIQAQILLTLRGVSSRAILAELTRDAAGNPEIGEALSIVQGLMGDERQIPQLIRILQTHDTPDFRALAARALGLLGAADAVPALETALQSEFTRPAVSCTEGSYTSYPVREAAETALRMIRNPEVRQARTIKRPLFAHQAGIKGRTSHGATAWPVITRRPDTRDGTTGRIAGRTPRAHPPISQSPTRQAQSGGPWKAVMGGVTVVLLLLLGLTFLPLRERAQGRERD